MKFPHPVRWTMPSFSNTGAESQLVQLLTIWLPATESLVAPANESSRPTQAPQFTLTTAKK